MKKQIKDEFIEPEVLEKITLLRMDPLRDPEAAERTRAKFMAELEGLGFTENPSPSIFSSLFLKFNTLKEIFIMKTLAYRTVMVTFAILLVVLALLAGGTGAIAQAARGSLPGDALYGVKTGIEQVRLTFINGDEQKARLYLEYAQRRIEEIKMMVQIGRPELAPGLVDDYNRYMQLAKEVVAQIAMRDPAKAAEIEREMSQVMDQFMLMMRETNLGEGAPGPGGGNNANGNEDAGGAGNDNGNLNANSNDNDPVDDNGNSNDNEGGLNGNDNGNGGDDGMNGNGNGNEDGGNGNENGSDDGGNGNVNGNDDRGNDNSNGSDDGSGNDNGMNSNDDRGDNGNSNNDDVGGNGSDSVNDNGGNGDNDGAGNGHNGGGGSDDLTNNNGDSGKVGGK